MSLYRRAFSACIAAILFTACDTHGSLFAPPGVVPQSSAASKPSWILPRAAGQNLLYIADGASGGTLIYTYIPGQYHFVGVLTVPRIPGGLCVDSNQDVFIPGNSGGSQVIYEYVHGGTSPIGILGESRGIPQACAVDPKTGNLAVAVFNSHTLTGTVAIYQKAAGTPKYYSTRSLLDMPFCAYDENGNLFVDGLESQGSQQILALFELPNGADSLSSISVPELNISPEGMQWSGEHLAVVDYVTSIVYQFAIKDLTAKVVGQTQLKKSVGTAGFLVTNSVLISAAYNEDHGAVQFYKYPAGGNPIHTITGVSRPYSVAVSLAGSKNSSRNK